MEYIAFDSNKRYTFASVEEHNGNVLRTGRINHCRGAITEFLSAWKPGTEVAVETIGNSGCLNTSLGPGRSGGEMELPF